MALFRADLTEASLARVEDDWMVIDIWHPGEAPRQVAGSSDGKRPQGGVGVETCHGGALVAFPLRGLPPPGAGAGRRAPALYKYGRFLAKGHVETAVHNARDVISLERALGVFSEARLQDLVLHDTTLMRFLNVYYLVAHVAVTAAAFLWLYVRHPQTYRRFRNVMVVITLTGMVVHLVLPLAPPRMFPNLGFVDTGRGGRTRVVRRGQPVQGLRQPVRGDAVAALRVGAGGRVGGVIAAASKLAVRGAGHPVITLAAIVLTANHYWLDAVVATFLFAVALGIDHFFERRRKRKDLGSGNDGTPAPPPRTPGSAIDSPSTYRPAAPRAPAPTSAACSRSSSTRG